MMMTMLFKREKNHKRIGTDGDLNFEISICITTSVLVLFIFIFTKKSSVYNEYISVFYGEGVRSVCLSVTAHKNFSKLYMYVCNVYLLVQFALLILSLSLSLHHNIWGRTQMLHSYLQHLYGPVILVSCNRNVQMWTPLFAACSH